MNEKPTDPKDETPGEGNRAADREYRQAATRHAKSQRSKQAARAAKKAVEGDEAEELEDAEEQGKARAQSTHDQRGEP
jgi:hypothetical protein